MSIICAFPAFANVMDDAVDDGGSVVFATGQKVFCKPGQTIKSFNSPEHIHTHIYTHSQLNYPFRSKDCSKVGKKTCEWWQN